MQTVFGRIHHTVVARPRVYGAAALIPEVCAGESVGLGREEVDEREGNGIDLVFLTVVQKAFLVFSLALNESMSDGHF